MSKSKGRPDIRREWLLTCLAFAILTVSLFIALQGILVTSRRPSYDYED
jgi:hypothetical protein